MWCSRRSVLTLAAAALAGCGYTPVYGPGGGATGLRGRIRPDDPDDRDAFDFVAQVEARLGRAGTAPYGLSYQIDTDLERVGITPGQETTRRNVVGTVRYAVIDLATGETVYSGVADTFTGYSTTGSIVSTLSAETDARARLMTALADQVVTELIATAPDWLA